MGESNVWWEGFVEHVGFETGAGESKTVTVGKTDE